MSDPRQDEPQAPPPATWAGRERSSSEERPPPEAEQGDDPAPGAEDEELEEELDADELDEEELAEELDQGDGPDPAPGQATVETDTPALADREAAREAALAGLRARTAEHAAKQPAAGAPVAPAAPPAAAEPKAPAGPPPAAAQAEAPAGDDPRSPGPEQEEGAPGRGLWPRFLAGSLLIIVAMTTATAVSLLVYLKGIARGLGGLPSVQSQLEVAEPGNPQTILILGSDKRPVDGGASGRSDTTILLRVASDQISVMSIPRDLKVNIPGHGIDRFNAAYSYGGPKLALTAVKQLTGLDNINHVVNVDFNGFAEAVNAIDCVYVDVDHHYYHSNVGLAASEQYAEIDVDAGYQRMCGFNALQYVRYRHEDNDLVRAARQQEFLREARQELPTEEIVEDRNELIDILKKHVTSDIEDETDLVSLGRLFIGAGDASVVQIDFPANLGGPSASYVTASESAIQEAVKRFEGESEPPPEPQPTEGDSKEEAAEEAGRQATPAVASPAGRLVVDGRLRRAVRRQAGGSADEGRQADARLPDPLPHEAGAQLDPDRRLPRLPDRRSRRPGVPRLQVRGRADHRGVHGLLRGVGHGLEGSADPGKPE